MSQPNHAAGDDRVDSDPLLAFNAELAAAPPTPFAPVEPATSPVEPAASVESVEPAESAGRDDRLAKTERGLERAQIEIASLKSDLATLVGTVDDIRKRLRPRPEPSPPPAIRRHHRRMGAVVAIVLVGMMGGVMLWRALSTLAADLSEPPPIHVESSIAPPPAAPAAAIVTSPQLQAAADVAPVESSPQLQAAADVAPVAPLPQLQAAADVAPVAPAAPARDQPARAAAPRVVYIGTLSIDADPGGQVYIDRKAAGPTPLRVESVPAGSHLVWIERDGFQRWTRVVHVPANRVTRVSANLEPR